MFRNMFRGTKRWNPMLRACGGLVGGTIWGGCTGAAPLQQWADCQVHCAALRHGVPFLFPTLLLRGVAPRAYGPLHARVVYRCPGGHTGVCRWVYRCVQVVIFPF